MANTQKAVSLVSEVIRIAKAENHCVYIHETADTNSVFYVGRAAKSIRRGVFERPFSTRQRSSFWMAIVAKHGVKVSIVSTFETKEEADIEERRLISFYGKRCNGGILCNLADGGQGNAGSPRTVEWREKMSYSHKGKKLTDDHKEKLSLARKGVALTDSHKKAISESSKKLKNFRLNDPDIKEKSRIARAKVKRKPRTREHQDKINAANKGSKRSLESRIKMSLAAQKR